MGPTTWLERITDESNVWLSATKAEDAEDYSGAALLYLSDASACLKAGSVVRSALGVTCGAGCLSKAGGPAEARRLYLEAGLMYSETAEEKVSVSIREALWALQRAYECFVLAGDAKGTESTYKAFNLLSKRANPFTGGAVSFELPKVESLKRVPDPVTERLLSPGAKEAVQRFLMLRSKIAGKGGKVPPRKKHLENSSDAEANFASQLG